MNHKTLSLVLALLSLALLGPAESRGTHAAPSTPATRPAALQPDVVLIVTDDQAAHTLQSMPETNRLIGDMGVRFTNAFVSTPLCCPSRASILTGLYTHNHNVLSNAYPLGGATRFKEKSTLATWLQAAGYRTGLFGKYMNGFATRTAPYTPKGWDEFHAHRYEWRSGYYAFELVENGRVVKYGSRSYSVNVLAAKAVQFIESTPLGEPLFVYFAPYAPHSPAEPGEEDRGTFASFPAWRNPAYNEAKVGDKPRWVRELPLMTLAERQGTDIFYRRQLETLQAVDRAVADIVDALFRTGRLANTAIVYTSDNGYSLGAHRWKHKGCVYEECVRVPLLVRAPGVLPREDSNLMLNVDLAPTIAEWAGVVPPNPVNGASFAGLLTNPLTTTWRSSILLENLGWSDVSTNHYANFYAIRTSRYVYAEYVNGDREFYDLQLDPYQLTNKVADPTYASTVADLKGALAALKQE